MPAVDALAQHCLGIGQVDTRVDADALCLVARHHGAHLAPVGHRHFNQVGEEVFALARVGLNAPQGIPHPCAIQCIHPDIHLFDVELLRRAGHLFDNRQHALAAGVAQRRGQTRAHSP